MYFPQALATNVTAKRAAIANEAQKETCGGRNVIASAVPITKTINAPGQLSQRSAITC